ncbi:hypothetical protein [Pedobacter sp. D749]|uniref:hypothetical protein n=1 Tax=Pedobacter sp. D749 TaxID=2856523 RepID=UPI001C58B679|nr:hypothetical protein [Pedobacter sp. D749]QXU40616.1 hypothetical protein KYH19_16625 [Pedobacter sp. D749]
MKEQNSLTEIGSQTISGGYVSVVAYGQVAFTPEEDDVANKSQCNSLGCQQYPCIWD